MPWFECFWDDCYETKEFPPNLPGMAYDGFRWACPPHAELFGKPKEVTRVHCHICGQWYDLASARDMCLMLHGIARNVRDALWRECTVTNAKMGLKEMAQAFRAAADQMSGWAEGE